MWRKGKNRRREMTTGDVVASNLSSVDVKLNENEDIIDKKAQKKVC